MELTSIKIDKPAELNVIIGMSHFIKTVEDVEEALICTVPGIKFGLAFCEASGPRLIRCAGNEPVLIELAQKNAAAVAAGHSFILFLDNAYPINVLNTLRSVMEIVNFFCATANPLEVIVAETETGRAILGVADGEPPLGIESEQDAADRKKFLRTIGYKVV
jgi:adenosine/AMP kinase